MMTRRGMLVQTLKSAGLFAAAAAVFGCGDSDGTQMNKSSPEVLDLDKKQAEARAKAAQDDAAKKK
jgi:hypothetical protein